MKSTDPHQGMLSAVHVYAIVGRAIEVQVSVSGRRASPGIVQKNHSDIMYAATPATLHQQVIWLAGAVGGMCRLNSTYLRAVDHNLVLRVAVISLRF
jgi:hypothetical protein